MRHDHTQAVRLGGSTERVIRVGLECVVVRRAEMKPWDDVLDRRIPTGVEIEWTNQVMCTTALERIEELPLRICLCIDGIVSGSRLENAQGRTCNKRGTLEKSRPQKIVRKGDVARRRS